MDYIDKYDIELQKEHYYAGEVLRGWVIIENVENLRITGVQVFLRGKSHVEWRITRGGERRTVKEDQYFIDEKILVWGKESYEEGSVSILPKDHHRFPFEFLLPEIRLPCSFESRVGTVRYYLRVIIDIPFASPPQGLKYFTVVGPHIDCADSKFLTQQTQCRQTTNKCLWCASGPVNLEASLERNAYCCGEVIRLRADVQNGGDQTLTLCCRLVQTVEYRIHKGAMGLNKEVTHQVLEYISTPILAHTTKSFYDLHKELQIPIMPPTMSDVCKLIEISYLLRVGLHMDKSGEDLVIEFPVIIATVPQKNTHNQIPELCYEPADDFVEGGIYISPEFQLGQVYDGAADVVEDVILYRPVYVCLPGLGSEEIISNGHSPSSQAAVRLEDGRNPHDGQTPASVGAYPAKDSPGSKVSSKRGSPQVHHKKDDVKLPEQQQQHVAKDSDHKEHKGKVTVVRTGMIMEDTTGESSKETVISPTPHAAISGEKEQSKKESEGGDHRSGRHEGPGGTKQRGLHHGKVSLPESELGARGKTTLITSHKESVRHTSHTTAHTSSDLHEAISTHEASTTVTSSTDAENKELEKERKIESAAVTQQSHEQTVCVEVNTCISHTQSDTEPIESDKVCEVKSVEEKVNIPITTASQTIQTSSDVKTASNSSSIECKLKEESTNSETSKSNDMHNSEKISKSVTTSTEVTEQIIQTKASESSSSSRSIETTTVTVNTAKPNSESVEISKISVSNISDKSVPLAIDSQITSQASAMKEITPSAAQPQPKVDKEENYLQKDDKLVNTISAKCNLTSKASEEKSTEESIVISSASHSISNVQGEQSHIKSVNINSANFEISEKLVNNPDDSKTISSKISSLSDISNANLEKETTEKKEKNEARIESVPDPCPSFSSTVPNQSTSISGNTATTTTTTTSADSNSDNAANISRASEKSDQELNNR